MAPVPFDADREPSKIKQVMGWLQESMAGQACQATTLEDELQALGYSHGTIYEARRRLKIRAEKRKDGWYWIPRQKQPSA